MQNFDKIMSVTRDIEIADYHKAFHEEYAQIYQWTLSGHLRWEVVPGHVCTFRLQESYNSSSGSLPYCELDCCQGYVLTIGNNRYPLPPEMGKAMCDEIKRRRRESKSQERKLLLQFLYE